MGGFYCILAKGDKKEDWKSRRKMICVKEEKAEIKLGDYNSICREIGSKNSLLGHFGGIKIVSWFVCFFA